MICMVRLNYVRATKGLLRYEEEQVKGQPQLVGVLYLAKELVGVDKKVPKVIQVTVTEDSNAKD